MHNNISYITNCTGCGTCYNACPVKAIKMETNSEGFLYPEIDTAKCTNCGLCFDCCPSEHPIYINSKKPDCLAVSTNDELRKQSSSGGVFPLLAEYILDSGGYVCGAAWNKDNLVEHIIIKNKNDLYKLKSSKYLQSNTTDVYTQIKKLLKADKLVLFSGTPCQVAGLNTYLKKQYDNLLTIDIVCHGVPSPAVYKKYLQELVQNKDEKVINTNFRDKINGWSPYLTTTITTANTYSFPAEQDTFMNAFLKNLCLRDSCSQCPFAKLPRQGDITLGDFWGIWKYSKKLDDKKGLSLVLTNSPKGKKYLQTLKKQTKLWRKVPIKHAINGNPCLVRSSIPHDDRKGFFERLNKLSLKDNVDITLGSKYDCGILNLWHSNNYGALLTCYALQETIKNMKYNPKIINYILLPYKNKITDSLSTNFAKKYLNLTKPCRNKKELQLLNEETNTFIVGSDQVWRYNFFKWYNENFTFYLNFANSSKKKIAYAASFGTDYFEGDYKDTQLTKYYMQQFDNISVREDDGVNICKKTFDVEATHVLDPVFLADLSDWDRLIDNSTAKYSNFIASYVLDKNDFSNNILNEVKQYFPNHKNVDMFDGARGEKTSVENWIYNIKNCDFFVTDSFHGACFAIIFNKPFICIANVERGYSRFKSLFNMFNLENRCILKNQNINICNILKENIDYNIVNKIKDAEIKRSKDWLLNALEDKKKINNSSYDIINILLEEIENLKEQTIEIFNIKKNKMKLFKYTVLSNIMWGKKRKKYNQKRKLLKHKILKIEQILT